MNFEPSFTRYLAAKKSVDDRALNRNVWDAFCRALPMQSPDAPLRVIEVGAGIGTMIERLIARAVLTNARYTAIDLDAANIAELNRRVSSTPDIRIEAHAIDVFDFSARATQTWDVLIAHAFLDLLDVPRALPLLFNLIRHGGLFYFTINFDGATIFEPTIDATFDAEIERVYHSTMRDSQTGRHLVRWLRDAGATIIQAGSSDWIVSGDAAGYANDEAYFLHFIIETMRGALQDRPEFASQRDRLLEWIACRHRQVEQGTLVYIAHQIDFVGRVVGTRTNAEERG
ncbi:MAG: class I SAM-dependent methyltransferase [Chloroflexi bacterium]|nr:class I SAM-dependent methyltransferase [Chloroflexota bacterium]